MKINELRALIREAFGNAYKFLGVPTNATPDEIKRAFRTLASQLHPDRNKNPEAVERLKKVSAAYNLLKDPESRANYDRRSDRGVDELMDDIAPQRQAPQPPPPSASSDWQWPPRNDPRRRPPNWGSNRKGSTTGSSWTSGKKKTNQDQKTKHAEEAPGWKEASPPDGARYFVYQDEKSNKFWWIYEGPGMLAVTVGWGRVGSQGQKKIHTFTSGAKALRFYHNIIASKQVGGYKEYSQPKTRPNADAPASQKTPPKPSTPGKKTTYKIYGRKGKHPIHTRFGGKLYAPGNQTKFKSGDVANVGLGSDGRLSVNNPTTNHTQAWDSFDESLVRALDELVLEHLYESVTR